VEGQGLSYPNQGRTNHRGQTLVEEGELVSQAQEEDRMRMRQCAGEPGYED
jgi:hypothetical protein